MKIDKRMKKIVKQIICKDCKEIFETTVSTRKRCNNCIKKEVNKKY